MAPPCIPLPPPFTIVIALDILLGIKIVIFNWSYGCWALNSDRDKFNIHTKREMHSHYPLFLWWQSQKWSKDLMLPPPPQYVCWITPNFAIRTYSHVIFFISFYFSLHCFYPTTTGEKWLSPKLSNNSCTNITKSKWEKSTCKKYQLITQYSQ